jgi:hypothetical protein
LKGLDKIEPDTRRVYLNGNKEDTTVIEKIEMDGMAEDIPPSTYR